MSKNSMTVTVKTISPSLWRKFKGLAILEGLTLPIAMGQALALWVKQTEARRTNG